MLSLLSEQSHLFEGNGKFCPREENEDSAVLHPSAWWDGMRVKENLPRTSSSPRGSPPPPTRTAYAHQVSRFLTWCEDQGLELHQVTPGRLT